MNHENDPFGRMLLAAIGASFAMVNAVAIIGIIVEIFG